MPPLTARTVCNTPLATWLCDPAVATGVLARPACATATAERHVPCRHTRPLLGGVHCSAVRASASAAATATANLSCGVVVGGADATLGCKQASWIGISVWTRLRMRVGRGWALCVANAAFFAVASAHHPRFCLLPQHYLVPWPLHLVIAQSSLVYYSDLFRFLLFIKRVALSLQRRSVFTRVTAGLAVAALLPHPSPWRVFAQLGPNECVQGQGVRRAAAAVVAPASPHGFRGGQPAVVPAGGRV